MVPWDSARAPSATSRASATAWEVSTLPATTAAGGRGSSSDGAGTRSSIGVRKPSLSGSGSPIRQRSAYITAARTTGRGALALPGSMPLVPEKSIRRRPAPGSRRTWMRWPSSMTTLWAPGASRASRRSSAPAV
jgi:hypothetical protein